jgi:hypothetical protein
MVKMWVAGVVDGETQVLLKRHGWRVQDQQFDHMWKGQKQKAGKSG